VKTTLLGDITAQRDVSLGQWWLQSNLEPAVGIIICSTQTYLSEVVPARLRGPVFALFPAFQLVGQLVAAVVVLGQLNADGKSSYRISLASEW
jgi:hypothetical protein